MEDISTRVNRVDAFISNAQLDGYMTANQATEYRTKSIQLISAIDELKSFESSMLATLPKDSPEWSKFRNYSSALRRYLRGETASS
jgi:hypothetical protein